MSPEADLVVWPPGGAGALPSLARDDRPAPPPPETIVEGRFHYTAHWFAPPDFRDDWRLLSMHRHRAPQGLTAFVAEGRPLGRRPPAWRSRHHRDRRTVLALRGRTGRNRLAKAIAGAVALSPIHFWYGRNHRSPERTAWPDFRFAPR